MSNFDNILFVGLVLYCCEIMEYFVGAAAALKSVSPQTGFLGRPPPFAVWSTVKQISGRVAARAAIAVTGGHASGSCVSNVHGCLVPCVDVSCIDERRLPLLKPRSISYDRPFGQACVWPLSFGSVGLYIPPEESDIDACLSGLRDLTPSIRES